MRARRTDPMSSHRAGAECSEWIAIHHRKIITALYEAKRPMIYVEIAEACGLAAEQVARRLKEIEINGHIKVLGPITMKLPTRKKAATYSLWNLTKDARLAIDEVN